MFSCYLSSHLGWIWRNKNIKSESGLLILITSISKFISKIAHWIQQSNIAWTTQHMTSYKKCRMHPHENFIVNCSPYTVVSIMETQNMLPDSCTRLSNVCLRWTCGAHINVTFATRHEMEGLKLSWHNDCTHVHVCFQTCIYIFLIMTATTFIYYSDEACNKNTFTKTYSKLFITLAHWHTIHNIPTTLKLKT